MAKGKPKSDSAPLMKIGELAKRSGLTSQVISSYCMYGLIREAARTPKGHRLFDERALRLVKVITDALKQKKGYTLRELREVFIRDKLKKPPI